MGSKKSKTRKAKSDSWKLAAKFMAKEPRTARELAAKLGISKIHAYRLIDGLPGRGVKLESQMVREHPTGPLSEAFRVLPEASSAS